MVNRKEPDIDITRNIKMIEGLKGQLLGDVAKLYKKLAFDTEEYEEDVADGITDILISTYLLGKRLGVTYNSVGLKMDKKIRMGIINEKDEEKYYGDLSELAHYLDINSLSK